MAGNLRWIDLVDQVVLVFVFSGKRYSAPRLDVDPFEAWFVLGVSFVVVKIRAWTDLGVQKSVTQQELLRLQIPVIFCNFVPFGRLWANSSLS